MRFALVAAGTATSAEQSPIELFLASGDRLRIAAGAQPDMEIVGCADTLSTATEALRKLQPDVALVGWAASSVGGQKIFSTIHELSLKTRVIMLANDGVKENFVEAVSQGCCGMVPKHTSTELLIKSIRKVHTGEFWLDRLTTADVIRRLARKRSNGTNVGARWGLREQGAALSQREH